MREVIRIDQQGKENNKLVELTYYIDDMGKWSNNYIILDNIESITYLGKLYGIGDSFIVKYKNNTSTFFKGHLNSGKY